LRRNIGTPRPASAYENFPVGLLVFPGRVVPSDGGAVGFAFLFARVSTTVTDTATNVRREGWPAALDLFIKEKSKQPFDWSTNNCGFFACDWLAMVVGVDPAADLRGKIDSALSAARVLDAAGGIEAIATDAAFRWGWIPIAAAFARRGDIVSNIEAGQDGIALGVCLGELSAYAHANGLAFRPTIAGRKAWRIG
jgi:hypothetical protein